MCDIQKEILSANIRKIRKAQNLSQAMLAEKAGITANCLSNIEQQKKEPRYDTVRLLAKAVNCTVEDLVHSEKIVVSFGKKKIEITQEILERYIEEAIIENVPNIRRSVWKKILG